MPVDSIRIDPGGSDDQIREQVGAACACMECIYDAGRYPRVQVRRHWSTHNPIIEGEFARPAAYGWYLRRELGRLVHLGAEIEIRPSRERTPLSEPDLLRRADETGLDITRKKLFLFSAERVDLSVSRLEHYTGTQPEDFQRFVLLTNYEMHIAEFSALFPECVGPPHARAQMPAFHHKLPDNSGFTMINIGVGPSNAKNLTDHLATLRPDAMLMIGHCAGVRNHQQIGDFVLASGYLRADRILDDLLPTSVPVAPNFLLNRYLAKALDDRQLDYRLGTVYTTADRNWELALEGALATLRASRAVAVDMESATVAANGFRFRVPHATLLSVSDKPLHGQPKLPLEAQRFYDRSKREHIALALEALESAKREFPEGLPNSDLRALDEPLIR